MKGRYTSTVSFVFEGDKQKARSLEMFARGLINREFTRLRTELGRRYLYKTYEYPDGSSIQITISLSLVLCKIFVPTVEEKGGVPGDAIFTLRPKVNYPRVVIIEDTSTDDGVSMIFADGILAGSLYTQALDPETEDRELQFSLVDSYNGTYFLEGGFFSTTTNAFVYSNGYRVADITSLDVIGAAVVENKKLVFVIRTSTANVEFYSHPMITVDFTDTNFFSPSFLIELADCTLEHTITKETYTGGSAVPAYTACTFSGDGTKGVFAGLTQGSDASATLTTDGWGSTTEQDIYDITLNVNSSGDLIISHNLNHQTYKRVVDATDTEELTNPSYTETEATAPNCTTPAQKAFYVRDWAFIERFSDYDHKLVQDVTDPSFGVTLDSEGTIIKAITNYTGTRDRLEDLEPGLPINGPINPTYRAYTLENGSYPFGGHAYNVESANYIAGIFNSRYDDNVNKDTSRRHNDDNIIKYTYEFPWITYSIDKELDQTATGYGVYGYPNKDAFEVAAATECDPSQQRGTIEDTGAAFDDYTYSSGYCLASQDYSYPKQFALRENVVITEHYIRPFQKSYMTDSSYTVYDQPTIEFKTSDTKSGKFGSRYITLESTRGSIDIPGLPSWKENLDKDVDSDSVTNTDETILVLTNGTTNYDTDVRNLEIPYQQKQQLEDESGFKTQTIIRMCSNPKGYVMYSMSDKQMQADQDNWVPSTTPVTIVTGLYKPDGGFVDLLAMYNALIADEPLLDLVPLEAVDAGNGEHYMHHYGVIGAAVADPGLDADLY